MKLISWNVNGIRAAARSGFLDWLSSEKPHVLGLQEIKAEPSQLDLFLAQPKGYHAHWYPAKKPGYSGVALLSREKPLSITEGLGIPEFDDEGRVLTADFGDFVWVTAYFPNSQRDHARLPYKLRFCDAIHKHLNAQVKQGRKVVLCGDYNIAHQEIDLANPKTNQDNAGFLPQERAWMTKFLKSGYVDVFREQTEAPGQYTWWSYRPGIRERNIGWRLDYHCVSENFTSQVKRVKHLPEVKGSDHCPVVLELRD